MSYTPKLVSKRVFYTVSPPGKGPERWAVRTRYRAIREAYDVLGDPAKKVSAGTLPQRPRPEQVVYHPNEPNRALLVWEANVKKRSRQTAGAVGYPTSPPQHQRV